MNNLFFVDNYDNEKFEIIKEFNKGNELVIYTSKEYDVGELYPYANHITSLSLKNFNKTDFNVVIASLIGYHIRSKNNGNEYYKFIIISKDENLKNIVFSLKNYTDIAFYYSLEEYISYNERRK